MAFTVRALIACIVGLLSVTAYAAEPPMRPLTFRVASFASAPVLYYHPRPEASRQAIQLPTSALSAACPYLGPVPIELFDAPDALAPVVSVAVSSLTQKLLIVLTTNSAPSGARLSVLTVEDNLTRFPLGSVGVINLSGRAYGAEFDGQWWDVPPGLSGPVSARGLVVLKVSARVADRWRRVTVFEVDFGSESRSWIVLLPPYRRAELQPRLRLLFDRAQ